MEFNIKFNRYENGRFKPTTRVIGKLDDLLRIDKTIPDLKSGSILDYLSLGDILLQDEFPSMVDLFLIKGYKKNKAEYLIGSYKVYSNELAQYIITPIEREDAPPIYIVPILGGDFRESGDSWKGVEIYCRNKINQFLQPNKEAIFYLLNRTSTHKIMGRLDAYSDNYIISLTGADVLAITNNGVNRNSKKNKNTLNVNLTYGYNKNPGDIIEDDDERDDWYNNNNGNFRAHTHTVEKKVKRKTNFLIYHGV